MPDLKNSPIPPTITVMLDKERELKYPIPSIFAFEDVTGLEVLAGGIENAEAFYGGTPGKPATVRQKYSRVIDMLWAGLIADDPKITREYVASFVYPRDMARFDEVCADAFFASLIPSKLEDEQSDPLVLAEESQPAS